ncbi:AAA family ATPase [Photobacterium damselae]|uniref:AAA family ATPase n=1 Tax=Photobacterium damselae TaxID=38293 RepID=UPI004068EBF5
MTTNKHKQAVCIFCNSKSSKSNPVIVGSILPEYGVCSSCNVSVGETIEEERASQQQEAPCKTDDVLSRISKLMKPKEIVAYLGKSIISQELAKKELASAMYEHMKRKVIFDVTGCCELKKANVFMMGKSGVSKTEMTRQLVKLMDIPMITIDCTALSEAGYVGDSIDDKMVSLVDKADGDIKKAEFGVVFLDEVDKLRRVGGSSHTSANVGREGVQEALLKIMEGTELAVSSSGQTKAGGRATNILDTSNILFIASGAFDGIEALLGVGGNSEIGFIKSKVSEEETLQSYRKITTSHLIEYGFKPEFIGRFYSFVPFDDLSKSDLVNILKHSSISRIRDSITSFKYDGCNLSFNDDSFEVIAEFAADEKTGARTLAKIVDTVLRDARYAANNGELSELIVDSAYVKEKYKK